MLTRNEYFARLSQIKARLLCEISEEERKDLQEERSAIIEILW